MSYNTKPKNYINEAIAQKTSDFSVKELCNELEGVSQATIYRVIEQMCQSGELKKTIAKDGQIRYQHLEECTHSGHCYLKCDNCGKLEHIDCEDFCDLTEHIKHQHHFAIDESNMVINGICEDCQ